MLGTLGEARVAELVDAIIDARATDALIALESLYEQGIDMRYLLGALATAWQHIATVQVVGEAVDDDSARWQGCAQRLDPRDTQLFYDITLAGIRDLFNAPDPLVGVKMCVLRMLAFKPDFTEREDTTPAASADTGNTMPEPSSSTAALSAREAMAKARAQLQGNNSGAPKVEPASDRKKLDTPDDDTPPATASGEQQKAARHAEGVDQTAAGVAVQASLSVETAAPLSSETGSRVEHDAANAQDAAHTPEPQAETAPDGDGPDGLAEPATPPRAEPANASESAVDGQKQPSADIRAQEALIDSMADAEVSTEDNGIDHSRPVADEPTGPTPSSDDGAPIVGGNGFDFATSTDHPEDWHALVPTLDVVGFAAQLANHGVCRHLDNARIELEIARSNALLATDEARERLQAALAHAWGAAETPRLKISVVDELHDTPAKRSEANADKRRQDAVASIENDPIIQKLRSQLGARLRPETIKPHRSPGAIHQRDEQ